MKYKNYKEYLTSDEWQRLRNLKLKQAEHKCQLCNSPEHLQIHHRTYQRLYKEDLNDLTVLCGSCHSKFHMTIEQILDKEISKIKSLINSIKAISDFSNIFEESDMNDIEKECIEALQSEIEKLEILKSDKR